jgi:hypothetical protein
MDKSLTTIHKTTDYDKFNLKFGNRPIDNAHVKKIMRSMTEEFINVPIAVNKRYEIVDGQHRFTAAKALGLPIFYRFATENLLSIRRMNQNTKNWTINDFLASYVAIESREPGNIGPYTQFKWFKEATNFPNAICLMMLTDNRGARTDKFKDGDFSIPSGQFEVAKKQAKMINECGQYYDGYHRRSFIVALLFLFKDAEFSFKQFIKKLSMNRNKLYHCTSTQDYLDTIERLYNWGNKDKVKFRRHND